MNAMGDGSLTDLLDVVARDGIRPTASDGFGGDLLAPRDQVEV
jgi:hypothetical protein